MLVTVMRGGAVQPRGGEQAGQYASARHPHAALRLHYNVVEIVGLLADLSWGNGWEPDK